MGFKGEKGFQRIFFSTKIAKIRGDAQNEENSGKKQKKTTEIDQAKAPPPRKGVSHRGGKQRAGETQGPKR